MKIKMQRNMHHATAEDFCEVMQSQVRSLYGLALLLTVEEKKAEDCVLDLVSQCAAGIAVSKDHLGTWCRRSLIKLAIASTFGSVSARNVRTISSRPIALKPELPDGLSLLEPFPRFVLVMTVMERISDRECSLLLNCRPTEVASARTVALSVISSAKAERVGGCRVPVTQPNVLQANLY